MDVSLILPTLNERASLPATLAAARQAFPTAEIIVSDGGSHDGTPEWVRAQRDTRIHLIAAPQRGRGPQMNTGAARAQGTVLLFLHADCLLPHDAAAQIAAALANPAVAGGCFAVRFAEREAAFALTAALINFQSRLWRGATGDQGLFVRRTVYDTLHGYKPWPLFEDIDFVDRLKERGNRFVVLSARLTISARRWQEFGVARTSLLMCALWIGYRLGVSPDRLKRWFTDVRPHLTRKR